MRWLQANALVQHGVDFKRLVDKVNPTLIYSPYTDFLFGIGDCPQVLTCHDLASQAQEEEIVKTPSEPVQYFY